MTATAVYEMVEAGEGIVIKLFPEGMTRVEAEREIELTTLARRYGLETPFVRGLAEHEGRLGMAIDKVYGPTFTQWMIEHPNWLRRLIEFFAHEHHEVHMHKVPELPGLKDVLDGILAGAEMNEDERRSLRERLKRMPDGDWLCHMNFVPDSMMIFIDGPVVFNWGDAVRGDYLADVAMSSLLMERWELRPEEAEAEGFKDLIRRGYEFEYLKLCGAVRTSSRRGGSCSGPCSPSRDAADGNMCGQPHHAINK
jgi:hypothetical protein